MITKVILFSVFTWQQWIADGAVANPGLQLAVTSKGLDYVADVGIPMLVDQLKTIVIPTISGKFDTPIGHVSYDLSNIKIKSFAIPTYSLTSGSTGLDLKTSDISVSINADWHYREDSWPHISDSGSADMTASSCSLDVSVILGRDSADGLSLKATGCTDGIGRLSIDFHGGASWLYNLFDDQIADSIKSTLSDSLCKTALEYIDTSGNAAVESIPFVSKLDSTAEINYKLFSDPLFQSTYFQTQHVGEFYSISKPVEAPCTAPALPPASTVDGSRMMYVWLSTLVTDSAAFVYQEAGALTYNITPNSSFLPPEIKLTTDFFGDFIPQLSAKYPHRPMELDVSAGKYPNSSVSNNIISLDVPGTLVALVQLSNGSLVPAFTLGLVIKTKADVMLTQRNGSEVIGFKDTLLSVELTLLSSEIGTFDVSTLQTIIKLLTNLAIIPEINRYGSAGIPVPTVEGISFVDASVTLGTNYIQIATDVNYKPTSFP